MNFPAGRALAAAYCLTRVTSRSGRVTAYFLLAVAFISLFVWLILSCATINSDALYYLTVARSVVEERGFTYDGIHQTTGFHWFWLALLVLIIKLTAVAINGMPRAEVLVAEVMGLSALLYASCGYVFFRLVNNFGAKKLRSAIPSALLAVIVFLDPYFITAIVNGLETPLFLLLLLFLTLTVLKRNVGMAAILFQLLIFTRIEAALLSPLLLWLFAKDTRSYCTVLPFLPWAVLLIFGLNVWVDDTVLSSSSMAKHFWTERAVTEYFAPLAPSQKLIAVLREIFFVPSSLLTVSLQFFRAGIWFFLYLLIPVYWLIGIKKFKQLGGSCSGFFSLFNCLVFFAICSYSSYKILYFTPRTISFREHFAVFDYQSSWYFVPLTLVLLAGLHLALLTTTIGRTLSVLYLAVTWIIFTHEGQERLTQRAAAQAASCQSATDGIFIAQNDDGYAFYFRKQVVVLDGLIMGHNRFTGEYFLDQLKGDRFVDYLEGLNPTYIQVGSEKLLGNLRTPNELIQRIQKSPVIAICGMGNWYIWPSNQTLKYRAESNAEAAGSFH